MRPEMPAWLEVLLNLFGYAGFLALASRRHDAGSSGSDQTCGSKR
jgi:hypothetical protein